MSSDTVATTTRQRPNDPDRFGSLRRRRRNPASLVLAVILTSQLMVVLDATIVNVALPDIKSALNFSDAQLSVGPERLHAHLRRPAATGCAGRRPARPAPHLPRRHHRLHRRLLCVGGFATAGWFLLAARALRGVGGALAAPSSLSPARHDVPRGPRAAPCDRSLHGRLDRRRCDRPDFRRHTHRVGVVAVGTVRQRPDRAGGPRRRRLGDCLRRRRRRAGSTSPVHSPPLSVWAHSSTDSSGPPVAAGAIPLTDRCVRSRRDTARGLRAHRAAG